ncbi:MAG: rhodanese-like domain-containing protein [Candidatus Margulisiibacteriota bacterium]
MKHIVIILIFCLFIGCKDTPALNQSPRPISVGMAHNLILQQLGNKSFSIVDVRSYQEFQSGHIDQAIHINYQDHDNLKKLDPKKTYLLYCKSGRRSQLAAEFLNNHGFKNVFNMTGGIDAWKIQFSTLTPSPLNESN